MLAVYTPSGMEGWFREVCRRSPITGRATAGRHARARSAHARGGPAAQRGVVRLTRYDVGRRRPRRPRRDAFLESYGRAILPRFG